MEQLRMQVFGRVQGVSFRAHTQAQARALSLVGWVQNEPDGSVRLLAEGPAEALAALERWARAGGPPQGRVDRALVERGPAAGGLAGFEIRR